MEGKVFFFFLNINVKLHFQKAKWAVAFQVAKENIRTKRCECFSLSFFRYNWENPNFLYFLTQPFYKNIYFHVFPVWMKGPKDLGLGIRIMYRFFGLIFIVNFVGTNPNYMKFFFLTRNYMNLFFCCCCCFFYFLF